MKRVFTSLACFVFFIACLGSMSEAEEGSMKGSGHEHGSHKGSMKKDGDYPPAFAFIKGTAQGSDISGKIKFHKTKDGLKAIGHLSGVKNPGKHGIHIHENGSCDDMGKAAGGHFNPHGVDHGFLPKDGLKRAHIGDMGNIEIDKDGDGLLKINLPNLSLEGENAVMGKAIILHEKEDDFGQPTGNAGGRIGCGIIVSTKDWKGTGAPDAKGSDAGSMKGGGYDHDHDKMKGSEKKGSY